MSYNPLAIQFQKTDTLSVQLAAGATSATLTTGNFGSPSGTQILVVDYDVPAKREVIKCTISSTSLTSLVRAVDGTSDVTHSANANVIMAFVPTHYSTLPRVVNRQGGTTGANSWATSGTSNTDVSQSTIIEQVGVIAVAADPTTVTFPTAFSQVPLVYLTTSTAASANTFPIVLSASTTQFTCRQVNDAGTATTTEKVNWRAIGLA